MTMLAGLTMRSSSSTFSLVTFLFMICSYRTCQCAPACLQSDAEKYSFVCHFDSHVHVDITADVLFNFPVEHIQSLRLEFNANENFSTLQFPFKTFFQFGFHQLTDLCIASDIKSKDEKTSAFLIDELEALPQLSRFTIHGKNVEVLVVNTSLQFRLRHLDVSSSRHINFDQLCKIVKVSGPTLEEVYAEGINDGDLDNVTETLNDDFFSCFCNTNLKLLTIPESNIKILSSGNLDIYLPSLEVLDVSRNEVFINPQTFLSVLKLKKLKRLIVSDVPFPKGKMETKCEYDKWIKHRTDCQLCKYFDYLPQIQVLENLEVLNIGGSTDCHKMKFFYCSRQSQCIFPNNTGLRELYLDHICIMRMDMLIMGLNQLEKLDFSFNLCEYISSLFFSNMTSLATLFLNGNALSKMAESDPEELRILFRQNSELKILNLSANGFSQLPLDMFEGNKKLEVLDLSKNFLIKTDWLMGALEHLSFLNLTENRIKELDAGAINLFTNRKIGNNKSVAEVTFIHVKLAGNPISCSCGQEDMIKWFANNRRYIIDIDGIVCAEKAGFLSTYTNDIATYSKACDFQRYKGLLALCIVPIIAIICAILYIRHYRHILRIRRIRKQLDEFIADNFHVERRFLLYLAYSFSDSGIVLNKLFPELESRLQKEIGLNENLICISDRDFGVGVSISDEIINAVSSSRVVLFILSKEFARSRWCEFEAEIALYQGKPIILVTLGDVKIRCLPNSLRKVCFKWTRLEWPVTDDKNKMECFWKKLVNAIIKYTDDDDTLLNRNLV